MKAINRAIEKYEKLILEAERRIWSTPETGFREVKSCAYLAERFRELGYSLTMAGDIPGFYTVVDTGREGPEVLVLGELDSVICPKHPESDSETGAVHSCGHNAQCAALLGVAAALREPDVLEGLVGRIRLCAVPAEELLEIEYRSELKRRGIIKYFGGKGEFLRRGYFDGVDMAFMIHTGGGASTVNRGANGCVTKRVIYKGRATHAANPETGINALYAANCGLSAVNALRETFRESNCIRVHPIITSGGSMVNAIPDTVTIESYVRGRSYKAILRENAKVNRAFVGAAYSLGANVEIIDAPGYTPLLHDTNMMLLAKRAFETAFPERELRYIPNSIDSGSTDMGDLCGLMPVVHPYCAGAIGTGHGADYYINDPVFACVNSAKWQLMMLKLLLSNGAAEAKRIKAEFVPTYASKEAFFEYIDAICSSGDRITYNDDGTATVR